MTSRAHHQIPDKPRERPVAKDVGALIAAYYAMPNNGAGGYCHIVLDDYNLNDDCVRFCLGECERELDEAGAAIMRAFLAMTFTQRRKAMGVARIIQARRDHAEREAKWALLPKPRASFGADVIANYPSEPK